MFIRKNGDNSAREGGRLICLNSISVFLVQVISDPDMSSLEERKRVGPNQVLFPSSDTFLGCPHFRFRIDRPHTVVAIPVRRCERK